jgi:tRNA pseudouridine38/39 synthase
MQEAANHLIGEHDFQNFCKIDFSNTTNHRRRILSASIQPVPLAFEGNSDLLLLVIKGTAFLWHQVWLARSTLAVRRS